jgi:glycosyltransferase involved in cell wall biosynthesis
MVLEAVASGLPVITLSAPPMNEWSRQPEMLACVRRFRYPAYSSAWIEHSHLCLPNVKDMAAKIDWAARNDLTSISEENRAWAETTFEPSRLLEGWENVLTRVFNTQFSKEIISEPEPSFPCHSMLGRTRKFINSVTGWRLPLLKSPLKK